MLAASTSHVASAVQPIIAVVSDRCGVQYATRLIPAGV
jgi:hypothetical protein